MRKLWSYNLHQRSDFPHAVLEENLIVVRERRNWLTRLDPWTGTPLWSMRHHDTYRKLLSIGTAIVYLAKLGIVQVLDNESGEALWQRDLSPDRRWIMDLVASDSLILAYDNRWGEVPIHALDVQTGALRWLYPPNFSRASIKIAPSGIILAQLGPEAPWEREKPGEPPHNILILDPSTGTPHTRIELPPDLRQGKLHVWGSRMIITTAAGQIYTTNPEHEHAVSLLGNIEAGIQIGTILDDMLFISDRARHVHCFDLGSARLRWSLPIEHHNWQCLPIAMLGKNIILGSSQGNLYIINPAGEQIQQQHVEKRILTNLLQSTHNTIVFGTKGAIVAYDVQRGEENQISLAGQGEEHDSAQ